MPDKKTVATINSQGRQSASFIRVASAVGWHVRAQMHDRKGIVAQELAALPNVTIIDGPLEDPRVIRDLFKGVHVAFINTNHWGDELAIGKTLADAARKAKVQHYIYSSMPDHSRYGKGWRALPLWSRKYMIETYVRQLGIPATFVYAGIYNNNFTSLPYPLFRMELQPDGTFTWQAPFDPNKALPWLDTEHDVGPALLQIIKEGPRKWAGHRIPLAFELLTPRQVCEIFSRALGRHFRYVRGPINIEVPVPGGYDEHLKALEYTLGVKGAPYFGPDMVNLTSEAMELWEGYRSMEEYAREVFPVEESNNGKTWMDDDDVSDDEVELDFGGSC